MLERTLVARNHAAQSENKIHDDAEARRYGFSGGLVPGRDVAAYMAHLPTSQWGMAWLRDGTFTVELRKPVYDGETVTIVGEETSAGEMALEVRNPMGVVCGRGVARLASMASAVPWPEDVPSAPGRSNRPVASPAAFEPGTVFGTHYEVLTEEVGAAYLDQVGESLTLFRHPIIAHPGWLLAQANRALMENVVLGPWIHVSSDLRNVGVVRAGDVLATRVRVAEEFERSGHRFARLTVRCCVDDRLATAIDHMVIYQPAVKRA